MGWVNEALEQLSAGQDAHIRPQGGSMRGRIESGDLVTVSPVHSRDVKVDDVVLVQWQRSYLLHLVREIRGDEFLIGNNLGKINGWVEGAAIRGRVTNVVHAAARSSASRSARGTQK